MKKHPVPAIALTLIAFATPAVAGVADPAVKSVADSNNDFAVDLYQVLRQSGESENLFVSPASVSYAMAMTFAGARDDTGAQIRNALRWTLDEENLHPAVARLAETLAVESEGHALATANALWGQQGWPVHDDFVDLTRRHYGAGFREVDFARDPVGARKTINAWVEEQTRRTIRELLLPPDIVPATILVLTNAVHFKGVWKHAFNERNTYQGTFRVGEGESVPVDMMRLGGRTFRYLRNEGFQALELPYAGDAVSMTLFVPDIESSLDEFERGLTREKLDAWLAGMRPVEIGIVDVPRFDLTCRYELPEALDKLGIRLAFTPRADFSGISPRRMHISNVIHETFLQVDEPGTEAAAATAVVMKKSLSFMANRPFFFVIRDHATGAVLFMGRFAKPASVS